VVSLDCKDTKRLGKERNTEGVSFPHFFWLKLENKKATSMEEVAFKYIIFLIIFNKNFKNDKQSQALRANFEPC
jgi:hypothetical protein